MTPKKQQPPGEFDWLTVTGDGRVLVDQCPRVAEAKARIQPASADVERCQAHVTDLQDRVTALTTRGGSSALTERRTLEEQLELVGAQLADARATEEDALRSYATAFEAAVCRALAFVYDGYERCALDLEAALLAGARAQLQLWRLGDLAKRLPIEVSTRARLVFEMTELSRRDFRVDAIDDWHRARPRYHRTPSAA
jgi:hypothetical protein